VTGARRLGAQVKLGIPGGEAVAAAAAEMMIPLKRIGTPEEAAGAMLMLASPFATFITGQARAAFVSAGIGPVVTLAGARCTRAAWYGPSGARSCSPAPRRTQAGAACLPGGPCPPVRAHAAARAAPAHFFLRRQ